MRTIAVLAQKGGVGKTTLTLHWAVEADLSGKFSAVIDTDPQASAAAWRKRRSKETPLVLQATPDQLQDALEACRAEAVQFAFVDTMPRVESSSVEAAKLADLIVIPSGPSIVDIEAIGPSVRIAATYAQAPAVIVLNNGRPGSSINEQAVSVLAQYGLPICPVLIMRRAILADAFNDGRAVRELEPRGKAASEIAASWRWLAKQFRRPT